MTSKERVERALQGQDADRPPFSFWYHFRDRDKPAETHAQSTLNFHRKFGTDLVKVMSDYPYPRREGTWHELKVLECPFPEQMRALGLIAEGLQGRVPFVETAFNPWTVARKLSTLDTVLQLKEENPQALLDALEAIAKSEANHARQAVAAGAWGLFLAIDNNPVLTEREYAKFSEPFDRMVLEAVKGAPLNILHLHGDRIYLDRFASGWPAAAISFSSETTRISLADARRKYTGVLMGGIDEVRFRNLTVDEMRRQGAAAREAAGSRFILAPGCSVPDDTKDEEMLRLPESLG